jgi:hypothetical protein
VKSLLASLFALSCLAAACRRDATPVEGAVDAAAPPTAMLPAAAKPGGRATEPLWQRAGGGDVIELHRLAGAVGAIGLLAGVEEGGAIATTALAALPLANDADLALGPLGAIATTRAGARGGPPLEPVLTAILGIAGRPARPGEALDEEGARACGAALVGIAARADLDRADRAVAVSAARALAEKGLLEPKSIPGDLDPPAASADDGG